MADEAQEKADAVTSEGCLGDQTTTTAIKYLDLSPLFASAAEQQFWVEFTFSVAGYWKLVASATPDPAPTIVSVTLATCMARIPADQSRSRIVKRGTHFLAYSSDAGILRAERTSPPVEARV